MDVLKDTDSLFLLVERCLVNAGPVLHLEHHDERVFESLDRVELLIDLLGKNTLDIWLRFAWLHKRLLRGGTHAARRNRVVTLVVFPKS